MRQVFRCSLAELYNETLMSLELRKVYQENNGAVMVSYGFKHSLEESDVVAELFMMYQTLIHG